METMNIIKAAGQSTIPMISAALVTSQIIPGLKNGMSVDDYTLLAPMAVTETSELWFAEDGFGERCVLKAYKYPRSSELSEDIKLLDHPNLVPLRCSFTYMGMLIEVYPFLRNGAINGAVPEDVIRETVLPGLITALEALHKAGIVHNDVKPENIFWSDDMKTVLLGDYGSITQEGERPEFLTPAYTDPFVLSGEVCSFRSDWFSLGMTLASIHAGEPMITETSVNRVLSLWSRSVRYEGGSQEFRRLVNGMIDYERTHRLGPKTAKKWCRGEAFGGEARQAPTQVKKAAGPITIRFEEPTMVAVDISGLIECIKTHWNDAVFLFQQGEFDRFLVQFDKRWGELCKTYHKLTYPEIALFQLTMDLLGDESFIWRGIEYTALTEMEDVWYRDESGAQDILTFLQRGQVEYYLKKKNASESQVEYASNINKMSRNHPEEALSQLFISLRGDDAFRFEGAEFRSTEDIVEFLYDCTEELDEVVDTLLNDRKFEAWLAYLGMSRLIEEIRRKCRI